LCTTTDLSVARQIVTAPVAIIGKPDFSLGRGWLWGAHPERPCPIDRAFLPARNETNDWIVRDAIRLGID
jgi:hypothetical protein